jgi:hypothetical protein
MAVKNTASRLATLGPVGLRLLADLTILAKLGCDVGRE